MDHFKLVSEYQPTGDQPQAIAELVKGFREGNQFETLLGVTGSGKTFTMANVIAALNKPTLVIAHNKTLAGQLYGEFKEFFPENAVEYFVSYYDYYQPEAYVPSSDTYIAKDSSINDEIDKLRLSATASLSERKDVVVVASVSCIYGLGSPDDYQDMMVSLRPGMSKDRDQVIKELIDIRYDRNDMDLDRSCFRVRGDNNRKQDSCRPGYRLWIIRHLNAAFLLRCYKPDGKRLDDRNKCHIGIGCHGYRSHIFRSEDLGNQNGGRTVRRPDNSDGSRIS